MYRFRRLTIQDATAFRDCWLRGLREHPEAFNYTPQEGETLPLTSWPEWIVKSAIYGAFDEVEQLCGIVALRLGRLEKKRHSAYIGPVYVVPEARGARVAKRLMEMALAELPVEVEKVQLAVSVDNTAATKLYASLGFEPWGVEPRVLKLADGRYIDEQWMIRRISQ